MGRQWLNLIIFFFVVFLRFPFGWQLFHFLFFFFFFFFFLQFVFSWLEFFVCIFILWYGNFFRATLSYHGRGFVEAGFSFGFEIGCLSFLQWRKFHLVPPPPPSSPTYLFSLFLSDVLAWNSHEMMGLVFDFDLVSGQVMVLPTLLFGSRLLLSPTSLRLHSLVEVALPLGRSADRPLAPSVELPCWDRG